MNKLYIIVEGKTDKMFLNSYLKYLKLDNAEIDFADGYANLKNKKTTIDKKLDEKYRICIIFDADKSSKTCSPSEAMKDYIENILPPSDYTYSTFLFPNDKEDGCLETLLEQIISSKHNQVLKCFDTYINCLKEKKQGYYIPNLKAKMYAYISSQKMTSNQRKSINKDYLFNEEEYWNLKSEALEPLKTFLTKETENLLKEIVSQ